MNKITRRQFLQLAGSGFSALALQRLLSACQAVLPKIPATPPTQTSQQIEHDETDTPPATAPTSNPPDMVVARQGEPGELVTRAITALGGMERFVARDSIVVIKPNICVGYHTFEYAATTNPWVVGMLVKLAIEAGARKVTVMDYPFGGPADEAYERSGIAEQVTAAGGEMHIMKRFGYKTTELPDGISLHATEFYDQILEADVLINVPIAKHHNLAGLTLAMKNIMGAIRDRGSIHQDLGQRIADLNTRLRSTLVVVDAVRILMENGPTGGSLGDVKKMDTIIASTDVVAADSYAAGLFGKLPNDLAYITAGAEMGLGVSDLSSLRIEEITVAG